jgi:hypothetical protein
MSNIVEDIVIPESPRVINGQQVYIYVPVASTSSKGISSYYELHFVVDEEGQVQLNTKYLEDFCDILIGRETYALSSRIYELERLNNTFGVKHSISLDSSTYVLTLISTDPRGNVISTSTVDLPIEKLVSNVLYNKGTKELTITFQNGENVIINMEVLVSDLVKTVDSINQQVSKISEDVNNLSNDVAKLDNDLTTIDKDLTTIDEDLESLKVNASEMEERINTLENLTLTYTEDNSTAYVKTVPALVAPKAVLSQISGMTYKVAIKNDNVLDGGVLSSNLTSFYVDEKEYRNRIKYLIVDKPLAEGVTVVAFDENDIGRSINTGETYVDLSGLNVFYIQLIGEATVSFIFTESLIQYEPAYFTELRDSKVTAIESHGANLLDASKCDNKDFFVDNKDGTYTITYVNGKRYSNWTPLHSPANKSIWLFGKKLSGALDVSAQFHFADDSYKALGPIKDNWLYLSPSADVVEVRFYTNQGVAEGTTCTIGDVIISNAKETPYKPYREPITYPIPEAIQNIDGYGMTDTTISFSENKVTLTQLSTKGAYLPNMNWLTNNEYDDYISFYILKTELNPAMLEKPNVIFDAIGYEVIPYSSSLVPDGEYVWYSTASIGIFISKSNLANYGELTDRTTKINTFKAWLTDNPVEILYELAEPITTDISDSLEGFDGLIEVEGRGKLKFVNEHGNAVPSAVAYVTRRRDD